MQAAIAYFTIYEIHKQPCSTSLWCSGRALSVVQRYRFSRQLVLTFSDLRSGYSGVECVVISRKYRELKRQGKAVPSP